MSHSTRRLLTGTLLVLAAGTGVGQVPAAAHAAGISATVDVNGELKVRSAPSLTAKVVGTLLKGKKINVACAVTGQKVAGKVRTTTAWDRLSSGGYISHGYVRSGGTIKACGTSSTTTYVTGTVRSTEGAVNLRTAASTLSGVARQVATGSVVKIACAVPGTSVTGTVRTSAQWDRLSDGTYISHAYVLSAAVKACPAPATPTPAVPVPVPVLTPQQFIAAAVPGAQQGWRQYGVPASVTIAQAILESGWGRSSLSAVDKNYFGIKCQNGAFGVHATGCHVVQTTECTKAGRCFQIQDAFRTYSTMARSFRDHGEFLKVNKRYAPAFAYTRDADKFIHQVWKAGYATDPNYVAKVTGIMKSHNLYQYDNK